MNKFKLIFVLLLIFLFSSTVFSQTGLDSQTEINGSLNYKEKIALPSQTTFKLLLVNNQASQIEDLIITKQEKEIHGQVPIDFKLKLDRDKIDSASNYSLQAVIKSRNNQVLWQGSKKINDSAKLAEKQEIFLKQVRGQISKEVFKTEESYLKLLALEGLAQIIYKGEEYILSQLRTASGVKYANEQISFWNKGDEALIEKEDKRIKAEKITLANYNPETVPLKAWGQEPFWYLELDEKRLELNFGYGENKLLIDRDQIKKEVTQQKIVYNVNTSLLNFQLQLIDKRHTDIMSGEEYLYTVKLKIVDKELVGGAYKL